MEGLGYGVSAHREDGAKGRGRRWLMKGEKEVTDEEEENKNIYKEKRKRRGVGDCKLVLKRTKKQFI